MAEYQIIVDGDNVDIFTTDGGRVGASEYAEIWEKMYRGRERYRRLDRAELVGDYVKNAEWKYSKPERGSYECVYIATSDRHEGLVKIGRTTKLNQRMRVFSNYYGNMTVLAYAVTSNYVELELSLHQLFEGCLAKVGNSVEWFDYHTVSSIMMERFGIEV